MSRKSPESKADAASGPSVEGPPLGGFGIGAVARMTGIDEHTL